MNSFNQYEQERHQLINQLLLKFPINKSKRQKQNAINEIAVTILRSRPLCRHFNGNPLTGVYQEIYLQVKAQLTDHLSQFLITFDAHGLPDELLKISEISPVYLYELQTKIFKEILLDPILKEIGLAAKKFPLNSESRAYALTELIRAINLSGRLCRPHIYKFSLRYYEIIYEEAVSETLGYICLNIDLYDPNRGQGKFMNWVNFKLDKTVLKCHRIRSKHAKNVISSEQIFEQIKQPVNEPDLSQILREYLAQDPDEIFRTTHIRNKPNACFTKVALARFAGESWENISRQLDVPIPTLSSFYNRWCRRFAPLLKTELKKHL
ncbi:MAG: hypothetical protein AAGF83_06305 [Cyanobacteria bacterium P01_G01_bin.67]